MSTAQETAELWCDALRAMAVAVQEAAKEFRVLASALAGTDTAMWRVPREAQRTIRLGSLHGVYYVPRRYYEVRLRVRRKRR